jgi:hypothetical protein
MVMLSASVIVAARWPAGLSQRELALRLGKRQAEIARWERGHVVPSPPVPRSACGRNCDEPVWTRPSSWGNGA